MTARTDFLFDFFDHVEQTLGRFEQQFGEPDPWAAYRASRLPSQGFLDVEKGISYRFHQSGCEVLIGDVVVDLAAGPEGRLDGVDQMRLSRFLKSRGSTYADLKSPVAYRKAFEALKAEGIIACPRWSPGPQLCYLVEAIAAYEGPVLSAGA